VALSDIVLSRLRGTRLSLFRLLDVQWSRESATAIGARNDTDAAYVNVRGLAAVASNDFITKAQLDLVAGGTGSAVLNFGATPGTNLVETVVVGQTGILAGSQVAVWMMPEATATHNAYEHAVVPMKLSGGDIVPGVGFTIRAVTDWRLDGTFKVRWSWR